MRTSGFVFAVLVSRAVAWHCPKQNHPLYQGLAAIDRGDSHFSGEDYSSSIPSFMGTSALFGNWLMRYNVGYEVFSMSLDKRAGNGILSVS
jgi:hypothetical protein